MPRLELTLTGRRWARANAAESIVARVALGGYGSDWPAGHVEAAIHVCNDRAANAKPRVTRSPAA